MKAWKALAAATAMLACSSTSYATTVSLQDIVTFGAADITSGGEWNHGWGEVNKLDGTADFVSWTHSFEFAPPAETLLSATLSLDLYDDDNDFLFCLWGCELGVGYGEDGSWDIGEIDTSLYGYDLEVESLVDGSYFVTLASLAGDFYIERSILDIEYIPVPEPGTLALLGLGLVGLGAARRHNS